ncbi:endonuclease VIII [Clostridium oryzae]|uniref:Formamidopyrimidine-DNA glycosylase n=1 Tax=Clostridium oryzae TaxID=1450648 RepID=A0A1V4IXE7_9CLOT|nr:endonuclease VIII [Clostridium oryzae]OPJ64626.1 formamidopyrimidine-DNA glycosylase [Clostridium oryzae]
MLEIPESFTVTKQLNDTIKNKIIKSVTAAATPHKFAFYFDDPKNYAQLLKDKKIGEAKAVAGQIEIEAEEARIVLADGVNVRYFNAGDKLPLKHQLHIEFEDGSAIVCSVQMYGVLSVFSEGENKNPYYLVSKEKISPLADEFDESYFERLLDNTKASLSVKAFLATEQRIPGLGNGVLQDILFVAGLNPKSKLESLTDEDKSNMYKSLKKTLLKMCEQGGRDTEKDLFGNYGGYKTILSNKTLRYPCPRCGSTIIRKAYLGGNIYYCPNCQPEVK